MTDEPPVKLPDFGFELFNAETQRESTCHITPRSARTCARAKYVNGMRTKELSELLQTLPDDGEYIHIVSNGNYDYYNFIPLFAERLGTIDELWGSTWTMNRANTENLIGLFDAGRIRQIHVLTGLFFKRRETAVYATLVQELEKRGQHYVACENHAKVLLIRSGDRHYVVEGSANWTANPHIEQNIVCQSKALWEFHRGWMGEYF